MKYKTIMGSALLGLTIILLTVSGSVIQAEITSTQTQMSTASGPFFVEEMKIVAGIDASKFGKPICAMHGELQTHSLWGELAYQLGKEAGYQKMQTVDDLTSLPNA